MKLRIVWITGLLLAALGQAHAQSLTTVVSFGPGAPRCAPASITTLALPACAAGTSFQSLDYTSGASFSGGAVNLSDVQMQKTLDDASPALLMDMLQGSQIPAMRLTMYKIDGITNPPVYEIVMQRVYVTGLQDGAAQGGLPSQSLSVAAGSIAVSVTTFDATGVATTTTATFSRP
jgi:type VI protein secretion system component Hcp